MAGLVSTLTITIGPAGSGKTYSRCAMFIVRNILPSRLRLVCNYPVNLENLVRYAREVMHLKDAERVVLDKIILLPEAWLEGMQRMDFGLWDIMAQERVGSAPWLGDLRPDLVDSATGRLELGRVHVALDEGHRFCSKIATGIMASGQQKARYLERWTTFVGEARHRHWSIELLSQADEKIHPLFRQEAGTIIRLLNMSEVNVPLIGVPLSEVSNLIHAATGKVFSWVCEGEFYREGRKWQLRTSRRWLISDPICKLYNSFSAPLGEAERALDRPPFWPAFGAFLSACWLDVFARVLGLAVGYWFLLGGGISCMMSKYMADARAEHGPAVSQTVSKENVHVRTKQRTHDYLSDVRASRAARGGSSGVLDPAASDPAVLARHAAAASSVTTATFRDVAGTSIALSRGAMRFDDFGQNRQASAVMSSSWSTSGTLGSGDVTPVRKMSTPRRRGIDTASNVGENFNYQSSLGGRPGGAQGSGMRYNGVPRSGVKAQDPAPTDRGPPAADSDAGGSKPPPVRPPAQGKSAAVHWFEYN